MTRVLFSTPLDIQVDHIIIPLRDYVDITHVHHHDWSYVAMPCGRDR